MLIEHPDVVMFRATNLAKISFTQLIKNGDQRHYGRTLFQEIVLDLILHLFPFYLYCLLITALLAIIKVNRIMKRLLQ